MRVAKRFKVHGTVQGVGFRVFSQTCAEALQVFGWVRNTEDGAVEIHAEGTVDQLKEFAFDISRGPRYARVIKIEERDESLEALDSFSVRH